MPDWMQNWWPLAAVVWSTIVAGFVAWVGWSLKQRFATREAMHAAIQDEHKDRKNAVGEVTKQAEQSARRLDLVESKIADLPTHRDLADITESLADLGERMASVEARQVGQGKQIDTVEGTVTRIHEYLLEHKS